jgi:anti-sigma regulatory factor (Ser/Thr protein kinase)
MDGGIIIREFEIPANDFIVAGEASSSVRKLLNQMGVAPPIVKRASVAMYEAEINAVIHGHGGTAYVEIDRDKVAVRIKDEGPGIPDLELAMQEGWSTAPDSIREMGFGAGMGLPNIKKHADEFQVDTEPGRGTTVHILVRLR